MRLSSALIVFSALVLAATLALLGANTAVSLIERNSVESINAALANDGQDWTEVAADGLQIHLSGTAPTEATRFRALSIAGGLVDAHRVNDNMEVQAAAAMLAPRFSVEILRNDEGISLIGLIPTATDRETVVSSISALSQGGRVADMLETADHPIPEGWENALAFSIEALELLPRSKISVDADLVVITAIGDSIEARTRLEQKLLRMAPSELELILDISAPRPVITPFTLRFVIEDGQGRFDACSADTEIAQQRIINAAELIGLSKEADCIIGLGNPSPQWARAVETAIRALGEIGGGSVSFSDADVTLVATDTTPQPLFDRIVGELETDLPAVFSLHSVLPEPVEINGTGEGDGPPEFVATLSPEGSVQLRGRLTNDRTREAVESYAKARFGIDRVYPATRLDSELPDGWPLRVLAGVEALSLLNNGSVVVQPDFVDVRGVTGDRQSREKISRILSDKLGDAENYNVVVSYVETLDPLIEQMTPEACVGGINALLEETKITFAPGSATMDAGASGTIGKMADILRECKDIPMEIGGHTDSQGREGMNQQLSQSRANAVLNALMARRVLTSNLTAHGYGETVPIADNETEEGREANRRIEFTLVIGAASDTGDGHADHGHSEDAPEHPATDAQDGNPNENPAEEAGGSEVEAGAETGTENE